MALIFFEGFDRSETPGWVSAGGSNTFGTGRFGGKCITSTGAGMTRALPSTYTTLVVGAAFFLNGVVSTDFLYLSATGTNAVRIGTNASSKLQVRNSGGTVIATGTTTLGASLWYYLETKAVINGASGTVECHLNGLSGEIASTTGNFGSTALDKIQCGLISGSGNVSTDDVYALDTTGSANTTFLGDVRVQSLMPSADGASTAWTPNSGSAHFSRVNEIIADDDTSYVSDSTVANRDSYAFADVSTAATVCGVQTILRARKTDAGVRQIAPVIRQGGTNYDGATVTLTASYQTFIEVLNLDPTAAAWTAANVNADEVGVKTVA